MCVNVGICFVWVYRPLHGWLLSTLIVFYENTVSSIATATLCLTPKWKEHKQKNTTWGPIITEQKRQNTTKDSFWLVHQNGGQYQQQQHGDLLKPCSAVKKGYATAFNNVDKQKVNFYDRWRGGKVWSNIHFPYTQNQWHKQQLTKEGFGESFS